MQRDDDHRVKNDMDLIIMAVSNQRDVCIHTIGMIRVSKIAMAILPRLLQEKSFSLYI